MRAYVRECVRVGCVSDRVTSQRAGWEGSGGGRGRGCAVVGVERSTTHSHSHAQRAASFETGKMEGSKCDAIFFFKFGEEALEKMVGIRGEARAPRSRVAPGLGTWPTHVKDRQVFA